MLEYCLRMLQCIQLQIIGKGATINERQGLHYYSAAISCAVQSTVLMPLIGPVVSWLEFQKSGNTHENIGLVYRE